MRFDDDTNSLSTAVKQEESTLSRKLSDDKMKSENVKHFSFRGVPFLDVPQFIDFEE